MKVKILKGINLVDLEDQINEFIKNKWFSSIQLLPDNVALIIYKEESKYG